MNVYEKLVDLIAAVLILLIFPMIYLNKKSNLITYQAIVNHVKAFSEDVVTHGELTKERYDQFLTAINAYDYVLLVELEYEEQIFEPKYELAEGAATPTFTNTIYEYGKCEGTKDILEVIYQEHKPYIMARGGYFQVNVSFVKNQKQAIFYGGIVRGAK